MLGVMIHGAMRNVTVSVKTGVRGISWAWERSGGLVCSPPGSSVHGILQVRYWSGLPCPPLGDLPNPGIKPISPALQVDYLPLAPPGKVGLIGECFSNVLEQRLNYYIS